MSCLALHSHKNLELDSTIRNHAYSISLNGGIVIDLQSHGSGDLDRGHEGTVGTRFGVRDVLFHNLKLGKIENIFYCLMCLRVGRLSTTPRYLVEVLALFLQRRGLLLPLVDALVVAVALPAELSDLGAGGEHLDHRCGNEIFQFLQWKQTTSGE